MRINSFEDVLSWQKAKSLYIKLFEMFKNSKDYTYKDQLLRAALSISNNIAEGFDRGSDKELKQFLIIARGSCAEVRSMLLIATEIGLINSDKQKELLVTCEDIAKLLTGFIKKLTTDNRRQRTTK